MLLAIARIPAAPEARAKAATVTGLAPADLNRRLAGLLPRVLFPALPPERADDVARALEALGFGVLTFDVAAVGGDDDRVIARRVELAPDALLVADAQGVAHRCPRDAVALLQRGTRISRDTRTVTTREKKFSVGRAVLSGGLVLSKSVEKKVETNQESAEAFLLVARSDGAPDIMLYERRMDYRALGPRMQAASRANLELVWSTLTALVPATSVDDRLTKPGFVTGLSPTAADPIDLALYLVALAHQRGLA